MRLATQAMMEAMCRFEIPPQILLPLVYEQLCSLPWPTLRNVSLKEETRPPMACVEVAKGDSVFARGVIHVVVGERT